MRAGLPLAPGVARQVVLSEPERTWQTLPIEQAEKVETFLVETGDLSSFIRQRSTRKSEKRTHMMKLAEASQLEAVRGQQTGFELVSVHPLAQSWIAPKLCPISCLQPTSSAPTPNLKPETRERERGTHATTCHSLLVIAVTPVPLVLCPPLLCAFTLHSCPSHATPTSLPLEQFVKRCHKPAPSAPPFAPRQAEKVLKRVLRLIPGAPPSSHPTFQGFAASTCEVEVGQEPDWTLSSTMPRETLNEAA